MVGPSFRDDPKLDEGLILVEDADEYRVDEEISAESSLPSAHPDSSSVIDLDFSRIGMLDAAWTGKGNGVDEDEARKLSRALDGCSSPEFL